MKKFVFKRILCNFSSTSYFKDFCLKVVTCICPAYHKEKCKKIFDFVTLRFIMKVKNSLFFLYYWPCENNKPLIIEPINFQLSSISTFVAD